MTSLIQSAVCKKNTSFCFNPPYTGIDFADINFCVYNNYEQDSICSELKQW
jgi:hypothetical protein